MPHALTAFTRPAPCCARITPTRTSGWRFALEFAADRLRDALRATARVVQRHERLPEFDAATLRDLGLSHAPASWTPRDPIAVPWR